MLAPLDIARHRAGPALRAPLRGASLSEWCAGLAQGLRLGSAHGQAQAGGLLRPPLDRPTGAPIRPALDLWLRTSLRERLQAPLASAAFRNRALFRMSWIDRMVRDHLDGIHPNGRLIWTLLCLETWFLTFVDRDPEWTIAPTLLAWDAEVAA